jgi:hypothetical protein
MSKRVPPLTQLQFRNAKPANAISPTQGERPPLEEKQRNWTEGVNFVKAPGAMGPDSGLP